jgi:hypothetical protein
MAESLKTVLMSALTSKATPAESDTLIVGEGNVLKKISFSQLFEYLKEKLGINALNTKINSIGKTARFVCGAAFYIPASQYSYIGIGSQAWNDIAGLSYVQNGMSPYYSFPNGTYLVELDIFSNTVVTSTIGWALSIVVNGITVYNPWFRMVNAWQSLHYAFIVKGSKLEINLYTDILIQIADGVKTSIAFTRLS